MSGKLEDYNRMRSFDRTPEPEGVVVEPGDTLSFVVQKHSATRLHYDFRLEFDGVFWSWAVPQGPTYDPDIKRLAVRTEDHPVAYGDFEGVIPKEQYGGGTVIVWDRGTWEAREDAAFGLKKGHLSFDLHGTRLHGHWHMIRLKEEGNAENWLLFKGLDGLQSKEVDITAMFPESVLSGRTLEQVAAEPWRVWRSGKGVTGPVDPSELRGAKRAPLGRFIEPELCRAVERPPSEQGWIHEIKYDGYRAQLRMDGDEVKLFTRSGLDWTAKWGHLAEAAAVLPVNSAALDGEVVVFRADGGSDFGLLQDALAKNDQDKMCFVAFDLLYAEGHDLRDLSLVERKAQLKRLLEAAPPAAAAIRYVDHISGDGAVFFEQAAALGLEGIISKRADAPYRSGRGDAWRKIKALRRQDFVVVGFTPMEGGTGLGALVLGAWEDGVLRPVGKVGTGFTDAQRDQYSKALATVAVEEPVVVLRPDDPDDFRNATWVQPVLVAQVAFTAWTSEDRLRHPTFLGLRDDVDPKAVTRHEAAPESLLRDPSERAMAALQRIKITTPERVLWPDIGVTKAELLAYWAALDDLAVAELGNRPLSLVRCPQGVGGQAFFQKHAEKGVPSHVKHIDIKQEGQAFLYVDDLEGILSLAQLNTLEFHPWGARVESPLAPDRIVFDLDPDESAPWVRVAEAAYWVRDRLEELGLQSFARTTGGKGLHVVVPLVPSTWPEVRAFSRAVAEGLVRRHSKHLTLSMNKDARRGRLLVDVLRNLRGATAVGTWSTRARPGAPIAVPLGWDEVVSVGGGARFDVRNIFARLASLRADPWAGFQAAAVPLTAEIQLAAGVRPEQGE